MNEVNTLLEAIAKHWGWEVGDKVRQEINAVIGATDVDIQQLQSAIQTIQGLLDADEGTPEFDVGQNIVTQLANHLTRITNLESDVATLKGDENTVGSVAYAVKQERDRALGAETALQAGIDANAADIATLNGDETVDGSVSKTAKAAAEAAGAAAVATAKSYADDTFVKKSDISAISAETLASMFRSAMDCGFNGATIEDVLNGTGDCATAGSGGDAGDGDGAVI